MPVTDESACVEKVEGAAYAFRPRQFPVSYTHLILDAMRKLLGEHPGISYVKWDCNRKISDPGSPWLDACRQGNLPIDYVRGLSLIHIL